MTNNSSIADEYICTHCGGAFTKGWSDDEALAEKTDNGFEQFECVIICDDCYHKIMDVILQ